MKIKLSKFVPNHAFSNDLFALKTFRILNTENLTPDNNFFFQKSKALNENSAD